MDGTVIVVLRGACTTSSFLKVAEWQKRHWNDSPLRHHVWFSAHPEAENSFFFFFGKRALNAHIEVVGGSKHVCTTYVSYPTSRICLATIVGERRERSACLPDTPNQVQNKGTHVRACFRLVSSGGRHHVRVVAVVLVGSCRLVSATLAPLARERPPDAHSSRGEFRTKRCCRARTMPCYCTFSQH